MMIKKMLLILVFPIFVLGNSHSMTWKEGISLLESQNPELTSSKETLKSFEELESVSKSGFYPHLSSNLSYSESDPGLPGSSATTLKSYNAQLVVTQNLFSGFNDQHKARQSKLNTAAQSANLQLTKSNLISQFKQAFAGLNFSEEYIKLTQEIISRRQQNLTMVQLRYESGLENKGSVLLYEAYLAQAQFEAEQSKHQKELSEQALKKILNLPQEDSVSVTEKLGLNQSKQSSVPVFEEIAANHPAVLAAHSQETSVLEGVKIIRSAFYPTLDLVGNFGETGNRFFPDNKKWGLGITLTIPLFDGFRDSSSLQASLLKWQATQFSNEGLYKQTLYDLKQAYINFIESIQKAQVDESFKKAVLVRAEISRNKYKNGLMSFDAWDQVENDLILRQKTALSSFRDTIIYEAKWEQAQGIGVL